MCSEAVEAIQGGELVEIDLAAGSIQCAAGTFHLPQLPANILAIFEAGGLVNYTRQQLEKMKRAKT
jgi:3-isopropylmalate dehydratase small subunit